MVHELQALCIIQLPVDEDGDPYTHDTELGTPDVEYYVCSCGEQFGQFDKAQEHQEKGE